MYPLETAKSLLTVESSRYSGGISKLLKTLVDEHGFLALYRGLVPTLIAMFPYVGVEFCTYETCRSIIVPSNPSSQGLSLLQTMSLGEKSLFLFPSYKAYGLLGDAKEIGVNTPLKIEIELIEIK